MIINIDISGSQVISVNAGENIANVIIDLANVWEAVSGYTDLLVSVKIKIPTLEKDENDIEIKTITKTEISNVFKINEIVNQKVNFEIAYPGIYDTNRQPEGSAKILGYITERIS